MTTAMHEILIVDDEEGFRHSLGLVLEMEGYRVREAGSGSEAIQAIALQLPDLVLLDLSMPGTSGWDVLHHIRQDPVTAHLPVLIVTAHAAAAFPSAWTGCWSSRSCSTKSSMPSGAASRSDDPGFSWGSRWPAALDNRT
jgi:CheY-like chemotaxis protein